MLIVAPPEIAVEVAAVLVEVVPDRVAAASSRSARASRRRSRCGSRRPRAGGDDLPRHVVRRGHRSTCRSRRPAASGGSASSSAASPVASSPMSPYTMPSPYASASCAIAKAARPCVETYAVPSFAVPATMTPVVSDREDAHRRERDHERACPSCSRRKRRDEPPDHEHPAEVEVVSRGVLERDRVGSRRRRRRCRAGVDGQGGLDRRIGRRPRATHENGVADVTFVVERLAAAGARARTAVTDERAARHAPRDGPVGRVRALARERQRHAGSARDERRASRRNALRSRAGRGRRRRPPATRGSSSSSCSSFRPRLKMVASPPMRIAVMRHDHQELDAE